MNQFSELKKNLPAGSTYLPLNINHVRRISSWFANYKKLKSRGYFPAQNQTLYERILSNTSSSEVVIPFILENEEVQILMNWKNQWTEATVLDEEIKRMLEESIL